MSNKQILKNMKNQKKQTALEWLEQEMLKPYLSMKEILEQAKEMEKEQIMDAHINGQSEFDNGAYRQEVIDNAEQYYNETYGGNK